MNITWEIKPFSDLSAREWHNIVELRLAVFVVEQQCIYQDLDGKDPYCYHLLGLDEQHHLIATARIVPPGLSYKEISIGRIATIESSRKLGLGHQLMKKCMSFIDGEFGLVSVRISAQAHLERFYNQHGFFSTGKEYLEDGIPHIEMLNKNDHES
jgi:ElaA protein